VIVVRNVASKVTAFAKSEARVDSIIELGFEYTVIANHEEMQYV
jgi:hypothetical protein